MAPTFSSDLQLFQILAPALSNAAGLERNRQVLASWKEEVLKKRYRELVKEWHPDRNKSEGATEKLAQINAAYERMSSIELNERPVQPMVVVIFGGAGGWSVSTSTVSTASTNGWIRWG